MFTIWPSVMVTGSTRPSHSAASTALGACSGPSEHVHTLGVTGLVGECFVSDEHDDGFASGGVSGCEVVVQVVLGHGGEADGLFLTG